MNKLAAYFLICITTKLHRQTLFLILINRESDYIESIPDYLKKAIGGCLMPD